MNDIDKKQLDLKKSILAGFEKAVYKDTPENRKLGRVGQHYGGSKVDVTSHQEKMSEKELEADDMILNLFSDMREYKKLKESGKDIAARKLQMQMRQDRSELSNDYGVSANKIMSKYSSYKEYASAQKKK